MGAASFLFLTGMFRAAFRRPWFTVLTVSAAMKLAVYLWWMSYHDEFIYVIYDYAPSMLMVSAMGLLLRYRGDGGGLWIAVGVAISFIGAGVQMSGYAPHRHFNHNDLYHVVQMAGVWCFFVGARELRDADT